jgi:hypothetical protein
VNAVGSMTGNVRNKLRTYALSMYGYGVANYYKVLMPFKLGVGWLHCDWKLADMKI